MKVLWEKHKVALTLFVMVVLAGIGFACLMTMKGYSGINTLSTIWSILTVLGVVFCIIAGIALVTSKTEREKWQKILLTGLWLLLVSGGSCGFLWMSVVLML